MPTSWDENYFTNGYGLMNRLLLLALTAGLLSNWFMRRLSFEGYTKRLLKVSRVIKPWIKKLLYFFFVWYIAMILMGGTLTAIRYFFCQRYYCPWDNEFELMFGSLLGSFPLAYFLNKYLFVVIYKRIKRIKKGSS